MKYGNLLVTLSLLFSCSDRTEHSRPVVTAITESVYATAKVKAVNQYNVYPTVSGVIDSILVDPGARVIQGQPLFFLENKNASLNTRNSELLYNKRRKDSYSGSEMLKELRATVVQARDKYLLDSALFIRQQNLWKNEVGSRLELDQRRLNYSASKNEYLKALFKLRQVRDELSYEQKVASISYEISKDQQSDFVIRSAVTGTVYDVFRKKGEYVNPQLPLAVIGKSGSFILEMQVDEFDIAKVRAGQSVEVTLDSYQGKAFRAQVSKVYPIIDQRQRNFKVDGKFTDPPQLLYPNLTAEANIIISHKDSALLIPKDYLVDKSFVYTKGKKRKKVTTGLSDYKMVEILEGLDRNEIIYKPDEQ